MESEKELYDSGRLEIYLHGRHDDISMHKEKSQPLDTARCDTAFTQRVR
jgi:hypothetical protein